MEMKRRVFSHCRRPEVKSEERASGKGFSVAGNFKEPGTGRANVENRSKNFSILLSTALIYYSYGKLIFDPYGLQNLLIIQLYLLQKF